MFDESNVVPPAATKASKISREASGLSNEVGHARLVAQIYAEAALNPALAAVVREQLATLRERIAGLVPDGHSGDPQQIGEAFVAVMVGYSETTRGTRRSRPGAVHCGVDDNRARSDQLTPSTLCH